MVVADYDALSRRAAGLIDAAIRINPRLVLALPTGGTPVATYAELTARHRSTGTDWSQVTTFNLDEYCGVGPQHPESYARFMHRHLFGGVNLAPERCHLPDGLATNPAAEAMRYEAAIAAAGGLDLAVLGIGVNGHLGFNEPGADLVSATHVADLTDETWQRNFPYLARAAAADPARRGELRRAYTMGIGTILQARAVLLLASGAEKRPVVSQAFQGRVTTHNPASLLQLHRDVTILLDHAAAG
ncbi:MAG: glucosamine-6-phosphate deaminase [Chloroflexota bacterium]|nr:glucosamine-6-phosphate deaminase [Chloroflexota bacterium]